MALDTTTLTWPHAHEEVRFFPLTFYTVAHMSQGISLANTPIAANDATADVALFLMLGALRRITPSFQAVRQGMRLFPSADEDFVLNQQANGGEVQTFSSGTTRRTKCSGSLAWAGSGKQWQCERKLSV